MYCVTERSTEIKSDVVKTTRKPKLSVGEVLLNPLFAL